MDRALTFFWIYILQILLFLWLYFLSISLRGDTYHAPPPPPWHWWIAPGPSPQRHHPISHGHTQTVGGLPVSQPAKTWNPGLFKAHQIPADPRPFSLLPMPFSIPNCEEIQLDYKLVLSKPVWLSQNRHRVTLSVGNSTGRSALFNLTQRWHYCPLIPPFF